MKTIIVVAGVLLVAAPLAAQGPRRQEHPRAVVATLALETELRVTTMGQSMRVGRVAAASDSTLELRGPFAGAPVRWSDVRGIETRVRATRKGATYGAIAGGVLGAASFAYISYGICDAAECSVSASATVLGGALGALTGALAGALVGSLTHTWRRIYP